MNESHLQGFRIVQHTHRLSKTGGSRVGYHCPECGCFYTEGNFTVENTTYVLGNAERKSCCGKERPTPRVFETVNEARDFFARLEASGTRERATLIPKNALVVAHFNQRLVREQKQKVLH